MPLQQRHKVIQTICKNLFTAEERRLSKVREQLIERNKELYPDKPHDGFNFKGEVYCPENLMRGPRTFVPLHFSLADQMEEYLKDKEQVWTDRHHISQVLANLLKPCESLQNIRDALPECIVDTLPELQSYSRRDPAAFTIQHDVRAMRQYHKALTRIEFYATVRLIY